MQGPKTNMLHGASHQLHLVSLTTQLHADCFSWAAADTRKETLPALRMQAPPPPPQKRLHGASHQLHLSAVGPMSALCPLGQVSSAPSPHELCQAWHLQTLLQAQRHLSTLSHHQMVPIWVLMLPCQLPLRLEQRVHFCSGVCIGSRNAALQAPGERCDGSFPEGSLQREGQPI